MIFPYAYLERIKPKIIFEFGSFDGKDAIELKKAFPYSIVISFEADPRRFEICKKNLTNFNIEIYHAAISNHTGSAQFYQSKFVSTTFLGKAGEAGVSGSLLKHTERHKRNQKSWQIFSDESPITIPCITIEDFCKEENIFQVDYIHMDVEGAVREVLEGFGLIRPTLIFAEVYGRELAFENSNTFKEYEMMFDVLGYTFIKQYLDGNALFQLRQKP